jgi:hypothetical protein
MMKHSSNAVVLAVVALAVLYGRSAADRAPERLLMDAALLASPSELAVVPSRTSSVYLAQPGESQSNLHSYVTYFDGRFWASWSSGPVEEDSSAQVIRYATSLDGHRWDEGGVLADDPDGPKGPAYWIARGIFVRDGRLQALNAFRDGPRDTPQGRAEPSKLVRFEWTGTRWENRGTYLDNCLSNYPPTELNGRWLITCRDGFGKVHTALTDSLTRTRWKVTPLPVVPPNDRMSEPSEYLDPDGVAHMIFRDQGKSRYLFRSLSRDGGRTWTAPVRTNYPDATSKNLAGRLSNGWYYLISNPAKQRRDPLVISFSRDGWVFERPKVLRMGVAKQRLPGPGKNPGFQYPHALEKAGSLWVIYNVNQEDIEISEFRISDFELTR